MKNKTNRKSKRNAVSTQSKAILSFLRDLFADEIQALSAAKKLA
jgi:hypothetical protein